jgi:ATP-binding cassette, subfamily B, bacterial PglK
MFKLIKQLFSLLTSEQKLNFYILQGLVVLMAFAELVGVASIAPFMALVGDIGILEREGILSDVYQYTGLGTPSEFLFWLGILVLLSLLLSAIISMYTTWKLSMYGMKVGTEIGSRLFSYYMQQSWLFHSNNSSSQLTKQIANESTRVTNVILLPLLQMNSRIVLVLFLSTAIFVYNPEVAFFALTLFAVGYLVLFRFVRKTLHLNGQMISSIFVKRFRLMNEGFGGIKDILLLGRDKNLIDKFSLSGKMLANTQGVNTALTQVPRYAMELVAFGSMIALILYLISTHNGNIGAVLPVLSIYALAAFKLLPAFQQIYSSLANIKGNLSAFEAIRSDLESSQIISKKSISINEGKTSVLLPKYFIELKEVFFRYPGSSNTILNNFNLKIPINKVVGIVGPSGSGKSTAIDVILSLIEPDSGQLMIDGKHLNEFDKKAWRNSIGFVPQSIFLSEGSIAENIAFGLPEKDIDRNKVLMSLSLAHLEFFVNGLESGMDTLVGERGVRLSGGQRQRIGIARALYNDAKVLVFDEATSSLDGVTEKIVMDAIHDFGNHKTIIMIAHRLKTVKKCDKIFYLENGYVVDEGSYNELAKRNEKFKKMAALS